MHLDTKLHLTNCVTLQASKGKIARKTSDLVLPPSRAKTRHLAQTLVLKITNAAANLDSRAKTAKRTSTLASLGNLANIKDSAREDKG